MSLTWKDAVATVFAAAIALIYVAYLNTTTAWLISSARGTAGAVLILGIVGGCALGTAADLYQQGKSRAYVTFASLLGATALVAGVLALVTASTTALGVLVVATLALWLVATARHAFNALNSPTVHGGRRTAH